MAGTDKRIDEYIEKSEDFAKPIIGHLRKLVHEACPDVQETIKWGMPSFEYKGLLCGIASFKNHAIFGFWKASLMKDPYKVFDANDGMGSLGKIKSLQDLPEDSIILEYIQEAVKLNDEGIKVSQGAKKAVKVPDMPGDFMDELKKNPAVLQGFEKFSPSHKKEYIEWITEAKTETTRQKRIAQAIEWISEGKSRNWKYMKVQK